MIRMFRMIIHTTRRDVTVLDSDSRNEKDLLILVGMARENDSPAKTLLSENPDLTIVLIPVRDWNEELSPYPPGVSFPGSESFLGHSDDLIDEIRTEILPVFADRNPYRHRILGGYSLAGLFALECLRQDLGFDAYISCSGSLWYPDYLERFKASRFRKPKAVYLSLGNREANTRNPVFASVGRETEALYEYLLKEAIPCTYVLNPGNHFQDPTGRLLAGIHWVFDTLKATNRYNRNTSERRKQP